MSHIGNPPFKQRNLSPPLISPTFQAHQQIEFVEMEAVFRWLVLSLKPQYQWRITKSLNVSFERHQISMPLFYLLEDDRPRFHQIQIHQIAQHLQGLIIFILSYLGGILDSGGFTIHQVSRFHWLCSYVCLQVIVW